jgi:hypothetical protein
VSFENNATAGYGVFTNNGADFNLPGSNTTFFGSASAGEGLFVNNGATAGTNSFTTGASLRFVTLRPRPMPPSPITVAGPILRWEASWVSMAPPLGRSLPPAIGLTPRSHPERSKAESKDPALVWAASIAMPPGLKARPHRLRRLRCGSTSLGRTRGWTLLRRTTAFLLASVNRPSIIGPAYEI